MDILQLFTLYQFDHKIRLGNKNDGGYVIADLVRNMIAIYPQELEYLKFPK